MTRPTGTGANDGTSTLSYDALGRLYDYVGTNGGRFLYDGAETIGFAPVGSSTLQNRFVRGPGVDEIVANFTTTGPVPAQYWAADERGSLVNLSEGATGASTVINTYDDYGVPAPTNLGRLQYTGQLWMPDLGAYHYKARAYQPGLGRFLQTDPIGYAEGANLYAYVGADPVNWMDPWGLARFGGICVLPATKPGTDRVIGDLNVGCISFTIGSSDPYSGNSLDWRFGSGGPRGGGLGSHFPGAGFSGPPIQSDPTYPSCTSSRQQAMDANAWMGVVALAPAAVVLGLETGALAASARLCNCFLEGTEVQTPDGFKMIEDVEVGDLVLARDEDTGESAYKPVVALIAGSEREIWDVTIETTDGQNVVRQERSVRRTNTPGGPLTAVGLRPRISRQEWNWSAAMATARS